MRRRVFSLIAPTFVLFVSRPATADAPATPGYPEPVVQWGTQKGETCADIASALYGSPKYAHLLLRYNRISCKGPLTEGQTLVAPAKVTAPAARLRSMHPDVQTRPPGGAWQPGASGQQLGANHNVETRELGRADIEFPDRTRVFLAPHTLVVIFDTAAQTKVSKSAPPRIEVQQGEVQAGLAALRGESLEVALPGGGQVSAQSRDTVIARQGERTTVAVFDGKAGVTSAGKKVEVPTNFGTRFVGPKPPDPPRPLPPAPTLTAAPPLSLGPDGLLTASWSSVPNAASYRVEVAREADFSQPLVREEVPADITSFRAEKLAAGQYYFRVRAIDREDYLGVAASRTANLVNLAVQGGRFSDGKLVVRAGARVALSGPAGAELAVDDGAFAPLPAWWRAPWPVPRRLRLRAAASQEPLDVPVEAEALKASVSVRGDGPGRVRVELTPAGWSLDEAMAFAPRARVQAGDHVSEVPMRPVDRERLGAVVPIAPGELLRITVLGVDNVQIGEATFEEARPPVLAPVRLSPPEIGALTPLWAHQRDAAPPWSPPILTGGATVSAVVAPSGDRGSLLDVRGGGMIGPLGLDGAVRTRMSGDVATDGLARVGARVLVPGLDTTSFATAVLVHAQLPTTSDGPAPSIEPSLSLGGAGGTSVGASWGAQVGGRIHLVDNDGRVPTSTGMVFANLGGGLRLGTWWRVVAGLDGRWLASPPAGRTWRGGGTVGFEVGRTLFGGAAVRGGLGERSSEGAVTGQITLGIRESWR